MSNFNTFQKDLDNFKKEVDEDRIKLVKNVATVCYNKIVERTPVDTGAARASWYLDIKPYVATIKSDCKYIKALEEGHSKQAPHGMVFLTMLELEHWNTEIQ